MWGGKRCGSGKKKARKPIKKDCRSEELKAIMRRNTEINDRYFVKQPKENVYHNSKLYKRKYYMGGW